MWINAAPEPFAALPAGQQVINLARLRKHIERTSHCLAGGTCNEIRGFHLITVGHDAAIVTELQLHAYTRSHDRHDDFGRHPQSRELTWRPRLGERYDVAVALAKALKVEAAELLIPGWWQVVNTTAANCTRLHGIHRDAAFPREHLAGIIVL